MVEKYGDRGFVVVGVTGEGEAPTMKYIEDTKWKATIVFESGLASMREYGFKGFPSSVLVNPRGEVVWSGHPAGLTEDVIESHLQGAKVPGAPSDFADLKPKLTAPKKYESIAKKIGNGQVGAGLAELEKALGGKVAQGDVEGLEAMKARLQALHAEEMKAAADALESKRYFDAKFAWTRLEKAFKGHALADEPKQKLAELAENTEIAQEIAAGSEIQKALILREADDLDGCIKALKRVVSGSLKQTNEAARAAALIEQVEAEKKEASARK